MYKSYLKSFKFIKLLKFEKMSLKNCVVKFYNKNKQLGKRFVAKHFLDEKVAKSTVYHLISYAEQGGNGERKKGSGRPSKVATKQNITWLSKKFNQTCGISQKSVATTLKCSQPYVSMMLKKHTNILCSKKLENPNEHHFN